MSKGKSCGEDMVVVEMLLQLDEATIDIVADMFKMRMAGVLSKEDEDVWNKHMVRLIPKKPNPVMIKDFRPIALLPVVYKWYSRVLGDLGMPWLIKLSPYQYAFRKCHQAHEVLHILRSLVEKSIEWSNICSLFVTDLRRVWRREKSK